MTHHGDDEEGVIQRHHETVLIDGGDNGQIADVNASSLSVGQQTKADVFRDDSETHGELNFL